MNRRRVIHKGVPYLANALATALLLVGCLPARTQVISEERVFPGLATHLAAARDHDARLHVILVHGMGQGDPKAPSTIGDSTAADDVQRLAAALGAHVDGALAPTCMATFNGVNRYSFDLDGTSNDVATSSRGLVFHEMNYSRYFAFEDSPYSDQVVAARDRLLLHAEDELLVRSGAKFNRQLKESVVTWGLSDAAAYLDPDKRDAITNAMAWALFGIFDPLVGPSVATGTRPFPVCRSYLEAGKPLHVVFITKSLGSKVLFDTLARAYGIHRVVDSPASARVPLFAATQAVYMLANQLPLLELGTESDPKYDWSEMWRALAAQEESDEALLAPEVLHVVAFSDPNDLLSFRIAPTVANYSSDATTVIGVDVVVPIATNWLGLFAWPDSAHTGHLRSSQVLQLLVHGLDW